MHKYRGNRTKVRTIYILTNKVSYKMIISTTQEKIGLKRIAVQSNNFATLLMDQNSLPRSVIGPCIHPKVHHEVTLNQVIIYWESIAF